jgi:hypothetical protein
MLLLKVLAVFVRVQTHKQIREAWLFGPLITDLNASNLIKVTARHKCD